MKSTYELRTLLGQYPNLFYPLYGLKRHIRRLSVDADTDLVIEGFPRSANTFAVVALELFQRPASLAHHLHVPAQVLRGVALRKPVLVLLRNPKDAALSLAIRHPSITLKAALRGYLAFYRPIFDLSDQYVIGQFEDVTKDYNVVLARLRDRFSIPLSHFDHTEEAVKKIFAYIDGLNVRATSSSIAEHTVARPSAMRGRRKATLLDTIGTPDIQHLLAEAESLYSALASSQS